MTRDFQLVFMDSMDKCLERQWLYHALGTTKKIMLWRPCQIDFQKGTSAKLTLGQNGTFWSICLIEKNRRMLTNTEKELGQVFYELDTCPQINRGLLH
jgi:hypothetical protein